MCRNILLKFATVRFIRHIHCGMSNNCAKQNLTSNLSVASTNQKRESNSALDICKEDVSDYAPFLAPTYNVAAYANKSHSIQQFIKLGVNLHKIEKKGFTELILNSYFERDVKKYIRFLHYIGVPPEEYGNFFTVNPAILKEDLDNLIVRINYLEAKKFRHEDIVRIISKNPRWISYSTEDIDDRLGFFQDHFRLSGNEVRHITVKRPKLITFNLRHIETIKFTVNEEMGFNNDEMKKILLQKPKVFTINKLTLHNRLDFLLNSMNLSHEHISSQPSVLVSRLERIKQRHGFLELLKKNQYDCKLPGYISLENLVRGNDVEFCLKIAGTSVQTYNAYLKSL